MTNETNTNNGATITLPEGQGSALSFSTADIKGMTLTTDGALVVSFNDGSQKTIENFRALAQNDVKLTLADGQIISTRHLFDTLAADMPALDIARPAAGESVSYELQPGQKYNVAFDMHKGGKVEQKDGALIITFDDNGTIILQNFADAMDGNMQPQVFYNGGQYISLQEFLSSLKLADTIVEDGRGQIAQSEADVKLEMADMAEKLAGVEPAAGGDGAGGGAGGFGFQSTVDPASLNSPDAIGPIGPTALQFGLPQPQDPLRIINEEAGPNPPPRPSLEVADEFVYEDGSVTLNMFAQSNGSASVQMTVVFSGIPSGWGVIPNGGVYDALAGTVTYTLATGDKTFTGGPTLSPPADSDIDIPVVTLTAINTDTSTGLISTGSDTFSVTTDAVADVPNVNGNDVTGLEDHPVALDITTSVNDTDGSEKITTVFISGVPVGFSLSAGTDLGGGTWQLTQAQLPGLQITPPADYFGTINLAVRSVAEEANKTDADFDLTNDIADNVDPFKVTWQPVIDPPSVTVNNGVDDAQVKEDGSVNVPITASLNPVDSPNAFLTVTVTGIDASWGFSAPVGTYNAATGTWTVTLPPHTNLSTVMTFTPPAQSDIDLTGLVATATATEPVTNTTATATDNFNIIVDAVADLPSVTATGGSGVEGTSIAVNISGMLGADNFDGSETITGYKVSGVPTGFTFNHGTDLGGGEWSFTAGDLAGLTITANDADFDGTIHLTATILTTENPVSDGEFDTTDNNNSASAPFTVTWTPDIDPPTILVNGGVDNAQVKEDGSVNVPITASLAAGHSANEFLTVTVTGISPAWGFSAPVGTYNAATGTWTVTLAPGADLNTVFTFTPPAQSDIDLSGLVAVATATDPVEGISASSGPDSFNIIVDAVADLPSIVAADNAGNENTALAVNINGSLGADLDGSEIITGYKVSGVPTGFTFNHGTDLGGGVWSFTPAQLAGLTMSSPADFNGSINLTATVLTTENPVSDGEFDFTDNDNSASDPFILTWQPTIDPPTITVNGGVDNALVKEDGSVNVAVVANLSANAEPSEYLTVTITGFNPAWGTVTAPVGSFNPAGTVWTVTLPAGADLNTAFTFTPVAQSDIDLSGLVAVATATDPVEGLSASSGPDGFNIIVDAVADLPSITATGGTVDEGNPIPVNIAGSLGVDMDGSEMITGYQVSGVPTGFTFNQGTNLGGGVWSFTPAQLAGLAITASSPSFAGSLNLTATVFTTENPVSDGEFDFTDNNNSASKTFNVTWEDDDQPILVQPEVVTVDETHLSPTTSISDGIQADFGDDAPGTFAGNGGFFSGIALKSSGVNVVVNFDTATGTYTGTAGANTVFTLKINSNGTYTFTLVDTLDHPNTTNHNDNIQLQFGVTATDADNDSANGIITVNVLDDGLTARSDFNVYETSAGGTTGNVITGLNGGAGASDLLSQDTPNTVTKVSFGGTTVNVPTTGFATISGAHGVLKIAADGTYTYTLNDIPAYAKDKVDTFIPTAADVAGTGSTLTKDDITITAVNGQDLGWYDVGDGGGVGIDTANIWGANEKLAITFAPAEKVSVRLADIGVPNYSTGGIEYIVQLSNGATVAGEYRLNSGPISGGIITLDFDADTYGTNVEIAGITLFTDPNAGLPGASFTLNQVTVFYHCEPMETELKDVFQYTLKDGDGDTSIASLNVIGNVPMLIVGKNIDDVTGAIHSFSTETLNPASADVAATSATLTKNGITVTAANGADLTWYDVGDGAGIGISPANIAGPSEVLKVSFAAADKATITLADFGSNNPTGGIDYIVRLSNGTSVNGEFDLSTRPAVGGISSFTLDASSFGSGVQIVGVDLYTDAASNSSLPAASFTLNNVTVERGTDSYWLIGCGEGTITGGGAADILVGDAGGSIVKTVDKDYNIVLILDVSGSMQGDKVALLKDAVQNLLTDFHNYTGGDVKVEIIPFSTGAQTAGTFMVTDTAGFNAAFSFVENLTADGFTNYEAPLQTALGWLNGATSNDPIAGAETFTYFVSDGEPNRYMVGSAVTSGDADTVMGQITGSDGSNEVSQLQSFGEVVGVGIEVNATTIGRLSIIDSGTDSALDVQDASDLSNALQGANPINKLAATGDDTIVGNAGNDLIFGDTLYTDALATAHGLGTPVGAGWLVFEKLEAGESTVDPSWNRDDTIAYIQAHAVELGDETITSGGARTGGNDTLSGSDGNDVIFGQEGNDSLRGGAGNDALYGGSGADTFLFEPTTAANGQDTVKDFSVAEGDKLDLSLLISGFDPLTDAINNFVHANTVGGNTVVSVDVNGTAGGANFVNVATLEGVTGLDVNTMLTSGTLVA